MEDTAVSKQLLPFIPESAQKILDIITAEKITKAEPLFPPLQFTFSWEEFVTNAEGCEIFTVALAVQQQQLNIQTHNKHNNNLKQFSIMYSQQSIHVITDINKLDRKKLI